ncbi:2OG-Fe(II) oxygenase [Aurantiacibacter spongiae]|uniref:Prolyl 3,4-dihydroxylase TPA1/OFD1 N-terminal domain-containing protein n=1 Tax=Aurantiacibacter spongiae TaxID=2488860 RepID=A0A3N5D7N1_9SPHN|nr:2OG-Fe(II) oxygenase family protein [Aurantiacibacter spongiae]RPF70568.1 hypothetical protein EG799_02220 [Aurantiacibacter spongiae]
MTRSLFRLNPDLDRETLARDFARDRRLQISDILTDETARELRAIMMEATPWGIAVQAGADAEPRSWPADQLRDRAVGNEVVEMVRRTDKAAAERDYAFRSHRYSLVEAVQKGWDPGGPYEILLEHLNAPDFLGLMREVTGIAELAKADGNASCFGPQHFLGRHQDSHVGEGWRIAYVLNMTIDDWYPDWGGYLVFFDDNGDMKKGYMPCFNTLNLFAVPQAHAVTYVPPFAPRGRYAISGWLRDR